MIYDPAEHELHRPDCPKLDRLATFERGRSFDLVLAPRTCSVCRPDVTTGLGPVALVRHATRADA